MKKMMTVLIIGVIAVSVASAHAFGDGRRGDDQRRNYGMNGQGLGMQAMDQGTPVKVDGKLALVNGMIAVKDKDKTYYVRGLNRLIGFVDGLKENAAVKLEGNAVAMPGAPEYQHLQVTKMTFNGKEYDVSAMMGNRGMVGGRK